MLLVSLLVWQGQPSVILNRPQKEEVLLLLLLLLAVLLLALLLLALHLHLRRHQHHQPRLVVAASLRVADQRVNVY